MGLKDFKALQKGCVFLNEFKRKMAKLDKGHKLLTMTLNNVSRTASRINARVTDLSKKMHEELAEEANVRIRLRDFVMSRFATIAETQMNTDSRLDALERGIKDKANKADLAELASEMAKCYQRLKNVETRWGIYCRNTSGSKTRFKCSECGYDVSADPHETKQWRFCPSCGRKVFEDEDK